MIIVVEILLSLLSDAGLGWSGYEMKWNEVDVRCIFRGLDVRTWKLG